MLNGGIGRGSGELYLSSHLYLPSLHFEGPITFRVDTGADRTCIAPNDLLAYGVDFAALEGFPTAVASGIGGRVTLYEVPGVLSFDDGEHEYLYEVTLTIPKPDEVPPLPSLLGLDILQRWRMTYDHKANTLTFDVHDADFQVPS